MTDMVTTPPNVSDERGLGMSLFKETWDLIRGDVGRARAVNGQALAAAEKIADPEDRAPLLADLQTVPGWSV